MPPWLALPDGPAPSVAVDAGLRDPVASLPPAGGFAPLAEQTTMAGIGPRAVALSQHGAGLRDLVFNASRKSFAGGVALSLPPPHPTTSKRRPSRGTRHSRWHCCLGPLSSTLRRPARSSVRRLPEVHPAAVCLVTSSTPRPTQLRNQTSSIAL